VKADFHLHTTASDGKLTPAELVKLAVAKGLDIIAITDHDTVAGIVPALTAAQRFPNLKVIPGIEISTEVPQGEVHILGYFINYRSPELNQFLEKMRKSRQERAHKMLAKLERLGISINFDEVLKFASGPSIGRPHIAQAMLERGYISSLKEAFDKYIGNGGPAYVERYKITPSEAIKLITEAEGFSVLAHPANIKGLESLIPQLKETGLKGIEAYYGEYSPEVKEHLVRLARENNLIASGGSDYHGIDSKSKIEPGCVAIPDNVIAQFISSGRGNFS
jgi:hypothetical protein